MATVDKIIIMRTDGSGEERDISAKTADVATKAEYDVNGKSLVSYVSAVEKTDTDLKVTKGNGTVSTMNMRMTGATAQSNGAAGFAPQPLINDRNRVLSGAGTWVDKVGYVGLSGVSGTQSLNVDGSKITIPYASSASSASNGIASFSKSGNTYTIRLVNGTSYQITDTNTTYSANNGVGLSGTTFYNTGVRGMMTSTRITQDHQEFWTELNVNGDWQRITLSHVAEASKLWAGWDYCYNEGNSVWLKAQTGYHLLAQGDGNLVWYDRNNNVLWQSGTSSVRFKNNIQSMTEERAKKILDVRAVTFDWNDDQPISTQKNDNAGVIAEEVSKIIPDVVVFEAAGEDGKKVERRVEYERFTPYLIKLAQMQQEQIEALTKRVEELEANK